MGTMVCSLLWVMQDVFVHPAPEYNSLYPKNTIYPKTLVIVKAPILGP